MGSTLPLTFWELVARTAKEHPDAPVVSDDHGRSRTFGKHSPFASGPWAQTTGDPTLRCRVWLGTSVAAPS